MSYSEQWDQHGAEFRRVLDLIEPTVRAFAVRRKAIVVRNRWDSPQLDIQWRGADGLWRGITIRVLDPMPRRLEFHLAAWKDDEDARRRRWQTRCHGEPEAAQPEDTLGDRVSERLREAEQCLSAWTEIELARVADLPARPEGWTQEAVPARKTRRPIAKEPTLRTIGKPRKSTSNARSKPLKRKSG